MEVEVIKALGALVNGSLNSKEINSLPQGMDFNKLVKIANDQKMQCMLLKPLLRSEELTEEQKKYIKSVCAMSFMKSANQLHDAEILERVLEEAGLKHQLLKGTVLKEAYPQKELRDMSDIDILIDEKELEQVDKVLVNNGFEMLKSVQHHDIYIKKPYTILEVHRYLSEDKHLNLSCEYFTANSENKLKEGKKYSYCYSIEYFYIFMIMHMARHFYERGCGIRGLVDIYVYKNKYQNQMDMRYLDSKLKEFHLYDFEAHMSRLTDIWLGDGEFNDFYKNLFEYMIDGSVYGKEENGIWSQFAREKTVEDNAFAKFRLKLWYLFPSYQYMANYNEWLRGKPYLLPAAWVYRAMHVSSKHKYRKDLTNKTDSGQIHTIQNIYKEMNLSFKA